ncbi:helix-turn-helix transcriptional regulator [Devosia indica]
MTDRIHPISEVLKITGLSRRTIYREVSAGRFPRPVQLSSRRVGWRSAEVQDWLDKRCAA